MVGRLIAVARSRRVAGESAQLGQPEILLVEPEAEEGDEASGADPAVATGGEANGEGVARRARRRRGGRRRRGRKSDSGTETTVAAEEVDVPTSEPPADDASTG